MRSRHGLAVVLSVALVLGGCKAKHSTTRTQPTLKSFSGWGLTFDYPGSWHAMTFRYPGKAGDAMPFVWLSNQELRQPCHRTSDGYGCDAVAVRKLERGGVVVGWRGVLVPTSVSPAFRDGVTFGRDALPGTETITRPAWCRTVAGDATAEAAFYSSVLRTSFLVNACLRGPDLARSEAQVHAMLASVRLTSPPATLR